MSSKEKPLEPSFLRLDYNALIQKISEKLEPIVKENPAVPRLVYLQASLQKNTPS